MDTVQKLGGKARRTRKLNTWAKAAGEYYREHKDEFNSFSEVLSSPKLREYYNAKYKNKKGGEGIGNANNLVGGKKKRKSVKKGGNNGGIKIDGGDPRYGGENTATGGTTLELGGNVSAPLAPVGGNFVLNEINETRMPGGDDGKMESFFSGGKKSRKSSKKSKK
jgi:hypothetical protein